MKHVTNAVIAGAIVAGAVAFAQTMQRPTEQKRMQHPTRWKQVCALRKSHR